MKNVTVKREGSKLTLIIDTSVENGVSKSGKSVVIATTEGNVSIPGTDIKVGLNVFRPTK